MRQLIALALTSAIYLAAYCITILPTSLAHASTDITDDLFLGVWSQQTSRLRKSVPVCIWNEHETNFTFRIVVQGLAMGSDLKLSNEINDTIDYRVHWLSGNNFTRRERLFSGIPSSRTYSSDDQQRCENGPAGMLRVTVLPGQMNNAPAGIYEDTLRLTISSL